MVIAAVSVHDEINGLKNIKDHHGALKMNIWYFFPTSNPALLIKKNKADFTFSNFQNLSQI